MSAGECSGCLRIVERLWIWPTFEVYCGECIQDAIDRAEEPDGVETIAA